MIPRIAAGLLVALVLAGCSSRYSPNNWGWFKGSSTPQTLAPKDGYEDTRDFRPLVEGIVSMSVDPAEGGVIVTATGLPPTQGYYDAALVPAYETVAGKPAVRDGVMVLEFRIQWPPSRHPVVNVASREVTTALFLSDQALSGASQITVVGRTNQSSVRR